MAPNPFLKGKNVKLTFQLAQAGGQTKNLVVQAMNFTVKPNGVQIADGILGEDRDELDFELNFYDVKFDTQVRNCDLLEAFLNLQSERDLKTALAESAVGILISPNDGTTKAYQVRKYTLDDWEFGVGGRTDRFKVPVPGRAKFLEPLPSLP